MNLDFPILLATALIPLLLGFIWYHPKVFGNAWMKAAGVTPDAGKGGMALIFILTYIFSVFIAMSLNMMTIHQWSLMSLLADNPDVGVPGTATANELKALLDLYGGKFRTFGHGALHGFITGIFFALPVLGVNALFERKGFKYIAINTGFWILCFMLMGGIICRYSTNY
jgi:Protein of unknown function (DUF1761)